eukprot:7544578-Alexandrium_andersonii.AAC.1
MSPSVAATRDDTESSGRERRNVLELAGGADALAVAGRDQGSLLRIVARMTGHRDNEVPSRPRAMSPDGVLLVADPDGKAD